MTYYNSWYFYCPRISLIPCCTRANWQQGAYTHDLLLYTFLSTCAPRARSCLYTHTHTLIHCAVYSANSAAANDPIGCQLSCFTAWVHCKTATERNLYNVVCASYVWRDIHTQTTVVSRVRASTSWAKAKRKADALWRRARWVRVVVVVGIGIDIVVQKGRVSCWGLKREQRDHCSSTPALFSCIVYVYYVHANKPICIHTHTHVNTCIYAYGCMHM